MTMNPFMFMLKRLRISESRASSSFEGYAEREQARPKVKDGHEAKYNVEPEVTQVYNHGFKKSEIKMIESVVEENVEVIIDRWKTYFGQE